jgi:hypothetical protein
MGYRPTLKTYSVVVLARAWAGALGAEAAERNEKPNRSGCELCGAREEKSSALV